MTDADLAVELLLKQFKSLDRVTQLKVEDEIRSYLAASTRQAVGVGQKCAFKREDGTEIKGVVLKINRKTVIVEAHTDRDGRNTLYPLKWHVSPQLVYPVA